MQSTVDVISKTATLGSRRIGTKQRVDVRCASGRQSDAASAAPDQGTNPQPTNTMIVAQSRRPPYM